MVYNHFVIRRYGDDEDEEKYPDLWPTKEGFTSITCAVPFEDAIPVNEVGPNF